MRAIILAAGQGTRLDANIPKCFIKVKDISILDRQVHDFSNLGIKDITVVVGDGGVWSEKNKERVRKLPLVKTVINQRSMETQSPYSLFLGMGEERDASFLAIDGDIVLEESVLRFISEMGSKSVILVKRNLDGSGHKVIIEEDKKKSYYLSDIGEQLISDYIYAGVLRLDKSHYQYLKETLSDGRHDNNYLSELLAEMSGNVRIECVKLIENKDGEDLLELAMMAGGSFSKTSKLAKGANNQSIIRKEVTPLGEEKLADEINWIMNLPDDVANHFPEIISHNINSEPTYFEMPCYEFPTLRTLILDDSMNAQDALSLLDKILSFMFKEVYHEKRQTSKNYLTEIHLKKIFVRLIQTKNTVYMFREIIDAESLTINGTEYENILSLTRKINQNWEMKKLLTPEFTCRTHGDLHFDNILIDNETDDFMLIDPRGNFDYDVYYDLGKIWHSCHGLYDFIHSGRFSLKREDNAFEYAFEEGAPLDSYREILRGIPAILEKHEDIKNDPHWEIRTLFSEASHFASVAPFHLKMDGIEEVATLCYLKGVELMNNIYNRLGDMINQEQIVEGNIINVNTQGDFEQAERKFD